MGEGRSFRRHVSFPLFQRAGETPVTNRFSPFEIPHNASLWSKVSTRLPRETLGGNLMALPQLFRRGVGPGITK
jgi:hypothetical protein